VSTQAYIKERKKIQAYVLEGRRNSKEEKKPTPSIQNYKQPFKKKKKPAFRKAFKRKSF
jgi:hypothetical protein